MKDTVLKVGLLTISDRAKSGEYEDFGGPAMNEWVSRAILSPTNFESIIVSDDIECIVGSMNNLVNSGCNLILTTGGTGPTQRDVTPEATMRVVERVFDGFAEQMRAASLLTVPTAILSRQMAGTVGSTLIVNLPGKPEAIAVCLKSIFLAIPKCLELIANKNIQIDLDFVEG